MMYDLALTCGRWDAERLIDEMSGFQFSMWVAYQELYGPISPNVQINAGLAGVKMLIYQLTSVMVRMWTKKRLPRKRFSAFLAYPIEAKKMQTPQDHLKMMEQLVVVTGGKDLRIDNG